MNAYGYNKETFEYTGPAKCQMDPVRSVLEGREIWLLPGDATWTSPPDFDPETHKAVYNPHEDSWKLLPIPEPEPGPEPETYSSDDLLSALLGLETPGNAGGGCSEHLEPQAIRGIALFLDDGTVAYLRTGVGA